MSSTTSHPALTSGTAVHSATSTCTSAVPDRNGHVPLGSCNSYYAYYPSFIAAVAFSALFGAVSLVQIVQCILLRKAFCWTIIMASLWETGSFVTRALGSRDQQNLPFAAINQILLLLAPVWVNAYAYMVAGRMIHCFVPEKQVFRVKARSLTKYFVWLDVVSFIVQLVGGSMVSPNASAKQQMMGLHVYMGGIGLQQLFIVVFLAIIARFHVRVAQLEKAAATAGSAGRVAARHHHHHQHDQDDFALSTDGRLHQLQTGETRDSVFLAASAIPRGRIHWSWLAWTLYFVLAMITIRIIYRLLEYSRGFEDETNPLPYHEVYAYTLDAGPMFFAILALTVVHPGFVLSGPDSDFPRLSRSEKKRLRHQKKQMKAELQMEKKRARNGDFGEVAGRH